jgi:lipopolysaccharide transport system ATP-binding protein
MGCGAGNSSMDNRTSVIQEVRKKNCVLGIDMAHIRLSNASVVLPIYNSSARSLTNTLVSAATGGALTAQRGGHLSIEALKELNIEIISGDRVGIIGHNGAGKSTLLRLFTGVFEPSSGTVERSGTISSLVDISLGINPENTGRENILLRGKLMGLSKKQINQKIDEIIEFSELGDYVNLPVRIYSSGMLLRLAFSVSTSMSADILIMDEWLSVGDGAFADRASKRLQDLVNQSEILVIASHNKELIEQTCNKVVWMEHGVMKKIGPTKEIVKDYFG